MKRHAVRIHPACNRMWQSRRPQVPFSLPNVRHMSSLYDNQGEGPGMRVSRHSLPRAPAT